MRPKLLNIIGHLAGWLLFFSLIIGFLARSPKGESFNWAAIVSAPFLIFSFVYLFLFYFNKNVLFPFLYLKKKFLLYVVVVLFLFAGVYLIRPFDGLITMSPPPERLPKTEQRLEPPGKPHSPIRFDISSVILFVTVWSLSTAIPILHQWRLTEKRALEAETERANAELSFLKAQINPHFLFNTLNNLYSLAMTKSDLTAEGIMKLSGIMRYVTDEVKYDFVPLDSEIGCMKDYIDLQRIRLGGKMNIDLQVKGDTSDKKIAPLLLMTFVENAFKYGISSHEPSAITIKLLTEEQTITFYCANRNFKFSSNIERSGIGIANARQRLLHLYHNRHFLDIDDKGEIFTVHLTLQA